MSKRLLMDTLVFDDFKKLFRNINLNVTELEKMNIYVQLWFGKCHNTICNEN